MKRTVPITFAVLLAVSPSARADAPVPLADTLTGPAKVAYESARLLIGNHDFAGARAKFHEAYELSHEPRLLFNVAACEKELHHYAAMQELLRRFEREEGDKLSPDEKARADAALAAVANLVGLLRFTVDPEGASVSIDGEPAGTTPLAAPVPADLGRHTITVEKAGYASVTKAVDVNGGAEQAVAVTLVAATHGAHLVVQASADTTVMLDGSVVGSGRVDSAVMPGTHAVRVTGPGKAPYETSVELRDGEVRTMDVTLDDKQRMPVWPWVVGGAALVAAGAAVGGYFLFRPEDHLAPPPDHSFGTATFSSVRLRP